MADKKATEAMAGPQRTSTLNDNTITKLGRRKNMTTADKLGAVLKWSANDTETGRWRKMLYRFLTDNVPVIKSCVWTWSRLAAAPGKFQIDSDLDSAVAERATDRLESLTRRLYANATGNRIGLDSMLPELFATLFRDGVFGGFLTVTSDGERVDQFLPVDSADLRVENERGKKRILLEMDQRTVGLDRPDFYYIPLEGSVTHPLGRSILHAVPFVTYVEQQLIDDMRRASHNSGFHRLHVKITPPERIGGESDQAFTERINGYFDSTVQMIKSLEVDDNPVTWDNVEIQHVAPGKSREVTNSWFTTHRAMVEEICAGTHLAPYLLGYSYGATTTWSGFKFDVVMRQVRSVQTEVAHFLEWIGNIDLALAGLDVRCRFEFDNSFAYKAQDDLSLETGRVDNVLKLYEAGLIDKAMAREKIWNLL